MIRGNLLTSDRRSKKSTPLVNYFDGKRYFFDVIQQMNVVKIFSGQWHVSTSGNEMLATILGSCISVCMRDPVAGIGGMNHFLLPGDNNLDNQFSASARYGVYAMECLINALLEAGARKDRFEIKIFGGGNVISSSSYIGSMNARFIRDFMRRESYRIECEDLEGNLPRRLHYYPHSGKVMLRHLRRREDLAVIEEEARYSRKIKTQPVQGSIELF